MHMSSMPRMHFTPSRKLVVGLLAVIALLAVPTVATPAGTIVIYGADSGSTLTLSTKGSKIVVEGRMAQQRPARMPVHPRPPRRRLLHPRRRCDRNPDGPLGRLRPGRRPHAASRSPSTSATAPTSSSATASGTPAIPAANRRNRCVGGGNDDICITGQQNSDCVGGPGDDYCRHGDGSDGCWGGPGDDVCVMGPGQDGCHGEEGNDRLYGGAQPDQLYGGPGYDYCDGGPGWGKSHECDAGPRR